MKQRIVIEDLSAMRELDHEDCRRISGRGVSGGYLFASRARGPSVAANPVVNQFFNTSNNFEVNNFVTNNTYETNNYIDTLIQQTVNQNQLNLVQVQAGNSASINVDVNQDLLGTNASVAL